MLLTDHHCAADEDSSRSPADSVPSPLARRHFDACEAPLILLLQQQRLTSRFRLSSHAWWQFRLHEWLGRHAVAYTPSASSPAGNAFVMNVPSSFGWNLHLTAQ